MLLFPEGPRNRYAVYSSPRTCIASIIPKNLGSRIRNFGDSFPWWDHLFRTYLAAPAAGEEGMIVGLKGYQNDASLGIGFHAHTAVLAREERSSFPGAASARLARRLAPAAAADRPGVRPKQARARLTPVAGLISGVIVAPAKARPEKPAKSNTMPMDFMRNQISLAISCGGRGSPGARLKAARAR